MESESAFPLPDETGRSSNGKKNQLFIVFDIINLMDVKSFGRKFRYFWSPQFKNVGGVWYEVVYFDPSAEPMPHIFRGGSACFVGPDDSEQTEQCDLDISPFAYYGMLDLGIIDKLEELPHQFILGTYEEGILWPDTLLPAAGILDNAASTLGNKSLDIRCFNWYNQGMPHSVQYRIKIPREILRKELTALASHFRKAEKKGYGVQLFL